MAEATGLVGGGGVEVVHRLTMAAPTGPSYNVLRCVDESSRPCHAAFFEWDDGNEEHLVQHGVSPYDVEQVFGNDPTWRRNKGGRAAQYVMDGRTDAGRPLRVLVLWADEAERVLRAVTAWDR